MAACGTCNGSGSVINSSTCHQCSGTGEIITYDSDGSEKMEACSSCEDGIVYLEQTCQTCKGTGEM